MIWIPSFSLFSRLDSSVIFQHQFFHKLLMDRSTCFFGEGRELSHHFFHVLPQSCVAVWIIQVIVVKCLISAGTSMRSGTSRVYLTPFTCILGYQLPGGTFCLQTGGRLKFHIFPQIPKTCPYVCTFSSPYDTLTWFSRASAPPSEWWLTGSVRLTEVWARRDNHPLTLFWHLANSFKNH